MVREFCHTTESRHGKCWKSFWPENSVFESRRKRFQENNVRKFRQINKISELPTKDAEQNVKKAVNTFMRDLQTLILKTVRNRDLIATILGLQTKSALW